MNGNKPNRKRPVLHTTVAERSLDVLASVCKEVGVPNYGVAIDYILTDWVTLKRMHLQSAAPAEAEAVSA